MDAPPGQTRAILEALRPGAPPPWLIPFCASCKVGVESFSAQPADLDGAVRVDVRCHGKTSGITLRLPDFLKLSLTGKPIVVFKGPLRNLVNAVTAAP